MRTSPKRTQLHTLRDFTGGLNLVADTFRLKDNESPDLLNVDIDRRGGFQVRRGVYPFSNTALSAAPNAIWTYNDAGTVYTMAQVSTGVRYGTGGAWTTLTRLDPGPPIVAVDDLGTADGTNVCPVVFNNVCYWARGDRDVVKWDGDANATVLSSNFNDTITPSSGNIPRADHMAVHSGYLWVAGTWEGGTHYPNRVRWSWANTFDDASENWHLNDYIDIDDGKDSDSITAIIPYGDQLIVFKRDSVYAVYGYSGESFSVVNISNTVGAVSHQAAIATPAGLFFFDHQTGLNVYNGKDLSWMFEQIWPVLRDGSIPSSGINNVELGWIENRLWVSVPWAGFNDPLVPRPFTFVLDPYLKSGGSWTKYSLQAGPYARGHRSEDYLGYLYGTNKIYRLDVHDQYYDLFSVGGSVSAIDSYYRTKWIDLGEPAIKKRWRRTEAVLQTDLAYELPVVAYANYDSSLVVKNFKFISDESASAAQDSVWGDGDGVIVPPEGEWDESIWARSGTHGYVDRGSNLGVARSVSLKVGGEVLSIAEPGVAQAPVFWGVDALILKFVPRRVR
jgi:hypothetical protein